MDWCQEMFGLGLETPRLFTNPFIKHIWKHIDLPAYQNLNTSWMKKIFNPSTPPIPGIPYRSFSAVTHSPPIWSIFYLPYEIVYHREGENDGLVSIEGAKFEWDPIHHRVLTKNNFNNTINSNSSNRNSDNNNKNNSKNNNNNDGESHSNSMDKDTYIQGLSTKDPFNNNTIRKSNQENQHYDVKWRGVLHADHWEVRGGRGMGWKSSQFSARQFYENLARELGQNEICI